MACPLKDKDGNLDDQALRDLTQVGGHVVEGGIKDYEQWKEAMKEKVGDVMNEGDLWTVWRNVKADAYDRTGIPQSFTGRDAFGDSLAKFLGDNRRAANFANDLVGPNGDTSLINKIIEGKEPLDAADNKIVRDAIQKNIKIRKPGIKATEGPMSIIRKVLDDAAKETRERNAQQGNTATRKGGKRLPGTRAPIKGKPREPVPSEMRSERYKVNREHVDYNPVERNEPNLPPTDEDLFDKHMASALGSKASADNFRKNIGDDLYAKLVNREKLSGREEGEISEAFADTHQNRAATTPSDIRQYMKPIADNARAELAHRNAQAKTENFENAKNWVREQITSTFPKSTGSSRSKAAYDQKLQKLDTQLDALSHGDTKGLSEVFNRNQPSGFLNLGAFARNDRLYRQGSMLSNSASLATAIYSHLLSTGVDNIVAKQLAHGLAKMGGDFHASVDPQMVAHAMAKSWRQVGVELTDREKSVLWNGENKAILENRGLHKSGSPLMPEFTVGKGGVIGNTATAVGRLPARMHAAAWHAIGVGLQDIALQDAAHYAAIDEMKKSGENWTQEQIMTRARELHDAPNEKVRTTADMLREEQMFQNKNALAEGLKKAGPIGSTITPFATVASNITGRALEHSIPGAAASIVNEIGKFAKDQKAEIHSVADIQDLLDKMPSAQKAHLYKIVARGIIGTGITAVGYGGYKAGLVNAPNAKRGEYGSVNIPLGNGRLRKVEIGRVLGPLAAPLLQGAVLARDQENKVKWYKTAGDLAKTYEENPLGNVSEILNEILGQEDRFKSKKSPPPIARAVASVTGQYIPSVVRASAAQFDPTHMMRDKNTPDFAQFIYNAWKSAIPGERETLKPYPGKYPEAGTLWPVPRSVPYSQGALRADRTSDKKNAGG